MRELITLAEIELREEHRIKKGVDYSVVAKYGEVYVTCLASYKETILDVFLDKGIDVTTVFTIK